MTARRHRAPTALLLAVAALLAGCGSDGPAAPPAEALLTAARTSLATAATVHFVLDSEGAPSSGLALLGGEGDAARPDRLRGTLKVRVAGLSADVDVVAVDGTFYARLPLAPGLTRTDPSTLGFGDPGALFSVGLTTLIDAARTRATPARSGWTARSSTPSRSPSPGRPSPTCCAARSPGRTSRGGSG